MDIEGKLCYNISYDIQTHTVQRRDSMKVSVVPCDSYDETKAAKALEEALSPLGGLDWVKEGMTVAIKANLVTFLKPEAAATTHPVLLCALVRMLIQRGARVILGDSPGGLYTKPYLDRIYAVTGMKTVEEAGAELNRDFSVKTAEYPEGKEAKTFSYTAWLDKADAIINFCKLKTHGMMAMSGAAKNMFGVIPGTEKPEYHYRYPDPQRFSDMIVDLDEYFKPVLSITDGIVGMEGNGPTAGTPRKIGVLLASDSPHAADLVGAALIGLTPKDIPTLQAAVQRNLIPATPEELDVAGNWKPFVVEDYKRVETTHSLRFNKDSHSFFGRISSVFIDKALASRPVLKASECVGCKECYKICPAKAITMKDNKPVIHRKVCIRCFCCQEFCPKGALKVRRTPIARLLVKEKKD